MKRINLTILIALQLAFIGCKKEIEIEKPQTNEEIGIKAVTAGTPTTIFETSFNNSQVQFVNSVTDDITGANNTNFPWTSADFGNKFSISYYSTNSGGTDAQRKASILNDVNTTNPVLRYWIKEPFAPNASSNYGRIQADLYGMVDPATNQPLKEFYQTVRLKLDAESFQAVLNDQSRLIDGSGDWLTFFEFWNDKNWDNSPTPFRITVGGRKLLPLSTNKFVMHVDATYQANSTSPWQDMPNWETSISDANLAIPIGSWMTVDIYFKEGLDANGRFWVRVTPDGGSPKVICDFYKTTHHPNDASPDGISEINPMKLYTSAGVVNAAKAQNKVLQVFWDNYKLSTGIVPGAAVTCGTPVTWNSSAFVTQNGTFTAEFDAVPGGNLMDGVVGLSNGAASAFTSLACAIQFANDGNIKARNGGAFAAANTVSYTAGTSYKIKMDVNVIAKTYNIYVTPAGGIQQTIGTGYAFRTEQSTLSQLNNRAINTTSCSLAVTNFTITSGSTSLINEQFTSSASNFAVVRGGSWAVSGGKYVLSAAATTGTGNGNISVQNTNVSGVFTLTADASSANTTSLFDDFSIIFNYTDANNYYYASFNEGNDANTSGIFKISGGTVTELADITSLITGGTTYAIKVVKNGSSITVLRNGVQVATATDATFSSGKVGFGTKNNDASFDNLVVNPFL